MEDTDEKNVFIWTKTRTSNFDDAEECWVEKRQSTDKKNDKYSYDVRVRKDTWKKSKNYHQMISVKGLPRKAIDIVDKPYTKSQYLRGAFRHEIRLPDEMLPTSWRDIDYHDPECGLYVAESSIPFSGLGMYTTKPIDELKRIYYGDVVIQIEDYKLNRKLRHRRYGTNKTDEPAWLLDNYYWNCQNAIGDFEAASVYSIVPGMGMLANSHTGLINAEMRRPTITNGGITRTGFAAVGSSTNFHDVSFVAYRDDIEAGSELFVEYGDSWFEDREDLGLIPLSKDFRQADKLLDQFSNIIDSKYDSEMAHDLWELLWNTSTPEKEDSRVRAALPRELEKVPHVVEMGTAKNSVPNRLRTPEWLKSNGICLDNIRPGKSTIWNALNGAFATRSMKEGQVVAPAPVVHILRQHLHVFDSDDVHDKNKRPWYDGDQLLINYCYGHPKSTVLLFPYAPVVNYINHHTSEFNTELRWSKMKNHNTDLLEMEPSELMKYDHSGMIMEFVATRDIRAGEEIFVNYGDAWDYKYYRWHQSWRTEQDDEDYVHPKDMNDFMEPVKTEKEQEVEPYPENLMTVCFVGPLHKKSEGQKNERGELVFKWKYFEALYETTDDAYPCTILRRDGDIEWSDSIKVVEQDYVVRLNFGKKEQKWVVTNVPRRAIEFFDDEYMSDLTFRRSFRHEIQLPDHMLPDAWIDRDPMTAEYEI